MENKKLLNEELNKMKHLMGYQYGSINESVILNEGILETIKNKISSWLEQTIDNITPDIDWVGFEEGMERFFGPGWEDMDEKAIENAIKPKVDSMTSSLNESIITEDDMDSTAKTVEEKIVGFLDEIFNKNVMVGLMALIYPVYEMMSGPIGDFIVGTGVASDRGAFLVGAIITFVLTLIIGKLVRMWKKRIGQE